MPRLRITATKAFLEALSEKTISKFEKLCDEYAVRDVRNHSIMSLGTEGIMVTNILKSLPGKYRTK